MCRTIPSLCGDWRGKSGCEFQGFSLGGGGDEGLVHPQSHSMNGPKSKRRLIVLARPSCFRGLIGLLAGAQSFSKHGAKATRRLVVLTGAQSL